jgi:hypothetical protein
MTSTDIITETIEEKLTLKQILLKAYNIKNLDDKTRLYDFIIKICSSIKTRLRDPQAELIFFKTFKPDELEQLSDYDRKTKLNQLKHHTLDKLNYNGDKIEFNLDFNTETFDVINYELNEFWNKNIDKIALKVKHDIKKLFNDINDSNLFEDKIELDFDFNDETLNIINDKINEFYIKTDLILIEAYEMFMPLNDKDNYYVKSEIECLKRKIEHNIYFKLK